MSSLERCIDNLEAPPLSTPQNPITIYKGDLKIRTRSLKKGLSLEDQEIADRLNRLHRDMKASENHPSDQELAARLAKLKGELSSSVISDNKSSSAFYCSSDNRESASQSEDLITAMTSEVIIDRKGLDPAKEIEKRLANLRGISVKKNPSLLCFELDLMCSFRKCSTG